MELVPIRYLLAVIETGSVTEAASRLHVSASAVSRAVAGVEAELGVTLLDRIGRTVRVNRFGRQFARSATTALADLDRAADEVRRAAGADGGRVTLGFLTSLGVGMVADVIEAHRRTHPQVSYALRQSSGRGVVEGLRHGDIDLGLAVPGLFDDDDVVWQPLHRQRLHLVVPPEHRLAARRRVALASLADEQFVALTADYTVRRVFDRACEQAGLRPNVVFEGTDIATLVSLIRVGVGVGVLPVEQPDPSVGVVRLSGAGLERTIALGRHRDRVLPAVAEELARTVTGFRALTEPAR